MEIFDKWVRELIESESITLDNESFSMSISISEIDEEQDIIHYENDLGDLFDCPRKAVERTLTYLGGESDVVSWNGKFTDKHYT